MCCGASLLAVAFLLEEDVKMKGKGRVRGA